ncbi:hypothetical protein LMG33818_001327 [Halomonadaceae bacterium LMG 33818]|uniref:hypothetical protein n=1 Tax=Cernens ardua TaxID=3402176 RepID=UPI003EDBEEFB
MVTYIGINVSGVSNSKLPIQHNAMPHTWLMAIVSYHSTLSGLVFITCLYSSNVHRDMAAIRLLACVPRFTRFLEAKK